MKKLTSKKIFVIITVGRSEFMKYFIYILGIAYFLLCCVAGYSVGNIKEEKQRKYLLSLFAAAILVMVATIILTVMLFSPERW